MEKKRINIKLIVISSLVVVLACYLFLFKLSPTKILARTDLIPFVREDFVAAMELSDTNKLVAKNDNFELYLNETNSYFKVKDLRNGEEWLSNPITKDPWEEEGKGITNTALNNQKATVLLQYYTEEGTRIDINNYSRSIYHPKTLIAEEGNRTFSINYNIDNGFQVLYLIEDQEIDYLYFPYYIPEERFLKLPESQKLEDKGIYSYDRAKKLFYIGSYEKMTDLTKKYLFETFYYEDGTPRPEYGYDRDISIEENAKYGYFDSTEKLSFEVAVQVLLTTNGFEVSLVRNSLKETKTYKFSSISLYPLLGTAVSHIGGVETDGYIVLPDGSGAILEFNNGKEGHKVYRKRVYGEDLALLSFKEREEQEKILIPLYGMVKENGGFAAIITDGDAQTLINADTSGRIDSYNKVYPTIQLRENEVITIGTGYVTHNLNLWTKKIVDTDLTISYYLLTGDDNNYVGVAGAYQKYLETEFGFQPIDDYENGKLTIEFLGAYDQKAFFLGVPYNKVGTLTTFKQASKVVKEFKERDIDLNVVYTGAFDGGFKTPIQTKVNIERKLGGQKGYLALEKELNNLNAQLYLQVNISRASSYRRLFDKYTYTASRLNGSQALFFTYHPPSGLPYSETAYKHSNDDYVINPIYYANIYNKLNKKLKSDNIAHSDFGSVLTGHYKKKGQLYKQDALRLQIELLETMKRKSLYKNPLGFVYVYADYLTDLPTNTTQYPIIDYHVPLLQLILSGYVPYTTKSINLNITRDEKYNFLRVMETGSNLKYTLTYDDPKKLINTEYNVYLATYYKNWIDVIDDDLAELNSLKLYEGRLIYHQRVQRDVYKVKYSNGLELYINYRLSNVIIDGVTVKSRHYVVIKEAN